MHDIRALREFPDVYARGWDSKGLSGQALVDQIISHDTRLRAVQTALQTAQSRRNEASKLIGAAKARKDEVEAQRLMAEVESLKGVLTSEGEAESAAQAELHDLLSSLPNLPAADVPLGKDEDDNVEVRRWGTPFAIANPRDHVALGEPGRLMDFEAAARMSGARFVVLRGQLARLERAIGQFMLDMQTTEHDYVEISPPLLVRDAAVFGTAQLPKFGDDLFAARNTDWDAVTADAKATAERAAQTLRPRLQEAVDEVLALGLEREQASNALQGLLEQFAKEADAAEQPAFLERARSGLFDEKRWLIPTAEVSLTNLVREQITPQEELPLRLTALTPSFRSEAGASGRDTRGMIRQHQFYKVELVSITAPEESEAEHERMLGCAEAVLKRLELPFRTMQLCAGDMGFSARKTFDLEVWIPSENRYREISSVSNCGDFQARRMDARTRAAGEKGARFVHTLNGSGLAVGRTLVAILENYQDENGRIAIPQALHPYMPGVTHIGGPKGEEG